MGNSNPSEFRHLTIISHPERWQSLGIKQHYEILRDSVTGEEVQQSYVHTGFNRSHEQQMQEYLFRNKHEGNIVKVIYADRINSRNFCVGSDKYIVRTERIPIRLAEIKNLTCTDSLYILREALIGFQAVYLYGKKATVTDQMIGLTVEGEVKVWVNSNFADNTPLSYGIQIRGKPLVLTEPEIVQQIFMTVRQHTFNKVFPTKLLEKTDENTQFSDAIRAINTYAWEENLSLTSKLLQKICKREFNAHHQNTEEKPQKHQNNETISTLPSPLPSAHIHKEIIQELTNSKRIQQISPHKAQQNIQVVVAQRVSPPPSRPVSKSGQKIQPNLIHPKPKLEDSVKLTNGIPNTVVNIQSKAIQLKQQTNPFDSKKMVHAYGGDSTKLARTNPSPGKYVMATNDKSHGVSPAKDASPFKDKIFIQNRESPSYVLTNPQRSNSQGHYMIEKIADKRGNNHFGHHVMQHKNKVPLMQNSQHKNTMNIQNIQNSADLKRIPYTTISTQKRQTQLQVKSKIQQRIHHKTPRSPKIVINLQSSQKKVVRQVNDESKLNSEARVLKPQFSFDPKHYTKPFLPLNERPASKNGSMKWAGVPSAVSITNSSTKNYQGYSNCPASQVIQPSKPSQNLVINTRQYSNGSRLDEDKILEDKIREIEDQLKYIKALNSKSSTPARSREQSMKGSSTNPQINFSNQNQVIKTSNESDRVKTSNTSLERLERFQKNGFFKSREQ